MWETFSESKETFHANSQASEDNLRAKLQASENNIQAELKEFFSYFLTSLDVLLL